MYASNDFQWTYRLINVKFKWPCHHPISEQKGCYTNKCTKLIIHVECLLLIKIFAYQQERYSYPPYILVIWGNLTHPGGDPGRVHGNNCLIWRILFFFFQREDQSVFSYIIIDNDDDDDGRDEHIYDMYFLFEDIKFAGCGPWGHIVILQGDDLINVIKSPLKYFFLFEVTSALGDFIILVMIHVPDYRSADPTNLF